MLLSPLTLRGVRRAASASASTTATVARRTIRYPHQATTTPAAAAVRRRVFCSASPPKTAAPLPDGLSLGASAAVGSFAGVISALTGAGGGLVLIPAFAKLTNMTQQTINGTQSAAVTFSVLLGAYNHIESGACNVPLALMSTLPSFVFAGLGVKAAHRLSSKRLSLVVGLAMLAIAPLMVLKDSEYFPKFNGNIDPLDVTRFRSSQHLAENADSSDEEHPAHAYVDRVRDDLPGFVRVNAKYVVAGCFTGFISGLFGLGGAILMNAYLTAASDMPQEAIIGTSMLSIVPMAASSTYYNLKAKSLHVPTAVRVGVVLGGSVFVTSKYITREVPEEMLRGLLATTLGSAAIIMMRRGL